MNSKYRVLSHPVPLTRNVSTVFHMNVLSNRCLFFGKWRHFVLHVSHIYENCTWQFCLYMNSFLSAAACGTQRTIPPFPMHACTLCATLAHAREREGSVHGEDHCTTSPEQGSICILIFNIPVSHTYTKHLPACYTGGGGNAPNTRDITLMETLLGSHVQPQAVGTHGPPPY